MFGAPTCSASSGELSSNVFGTTAPFFASTANSMPTFGTTGATPVFGSTNSAPAFGIPMSTPAFGAQGIAPAFGIPASISSFGATNRTPVFGGGSDSSFGTTGSMPAVQRQQYTGSTSSGSSSGFGTTAAFSSIGTRPIFANTSSSSAFGSVNATSPAFGTVSSTPAFGTNLTSPFGTGHTTSTFGTTNVVPSLMTTMATPMFGTTTAIPTVGATTPVFGAMRSQPLFGATRTNPTLEATSTAALFGMANRTAFVTTTTATPSFVTVSPTSAFGSTSAPLVISNTTTLAPAIRTSNAPHVFSTNATMPTFRKSLGPPAFDSTSTLPAFAASTTSSALFGHSSSRPIFGASNETSAFGATSYASRAPLFGTSTGMPVFGVSGTSESTTAGQIFGTTSAPTVMRTTNPVPVFRPATEAFGTASVSPTFGAITATQVVCATTASQAVSKNSVDFTTSTAMSTSGVIGALPILNSTSEISTSFDAQRTTPVFSTSTMPGSASFFDQVNTAPSAAISKQYSREMPATSQVPHGIVGSAFGSAQSTIGSSQPSTVSMSSGATFGNHSSYTTSVTPVFGGVGNQTTASSSQVTHSEMPGLGGTILSLPKSGIFGGSRQSTGTEVIGSRLTHTTDNVQEQKLRQHANVFGGSSSIFGESSNINKPASLANSGSLSDSRTQRSDVKVATSHSQIFRGSSGTASAGESSLHTEAKHISSAGVFGGTKTSSTSQQTHVLKSSQRPRSVFGSTSTSNQTGDDPGPSAITIRPPESIFGTKPIAPLATTTTSIFGTQSTRQSSVFGRLGTLSTAGNIDPPAQPVFSGTWSDTTQSSIFGGSSQMKPDVFGTSSFGSGTVSVTTQDSHGTEDENMLKRKPFRKRDAMFDTIRTESQIMPRAKRKTDDNVEAPRDILKNKAEISRRGEQKRDVRDSGPGTSRRRSAENEGNGVHPSRKLQRLTSSEEFGTKVAIVCQGVPKRVNNAFELRRFFKRFGEVTKVFPNPTKKAATIHFRTHADAEEAKQYGCVIVPGEPPMRIFWSSHYPSPSSSKVSISSFARSSSRESRRSDSSSSRIHSGPSTSATSSHSEIDDELSSMAGTSDVSDESLHYVARPHSDSSDSPGKVRPVTKTASSMASSSISKAMTMKSSQQPVLPLPAVTLSTLVKSLSKTPSEKLSILDVRDRLLKQGRKKQSDLATAQAFIGTCQDMCPEKERYDRQEKRRLNSYEIVPGTDGTPGQNPQVDHIRAVKEYSRSSADQEEPFSHELRPSSVLVRTMSYLLMEIADQGSDGKWAEWFDYLWDRTRGIRKDITQQLLCDQAAVELTEKCARFHIFCSERLCEEDVNNFDGKINNENLTKCLQSLKELYHDLEEKHAQTCATEKEFRAYMVLMRLNDGDILREVQQLRQDIRESAEIQFALKVYSALNSNNYIRFFKLVSEASFMTACIMHRYFTQVRVRAIQTMLAAYSLPVVKTTLYPVSEVTRLLMFEDEDDAGEFCSHYGLTIQESEVHLSRSAFILPEDAFPAMRADKLIESKLYTSVGEAINGGPLPSLSLPQPQSSFDEQGRYCGEMPAGAGGEGEPEPERRLSPTPISETPASLPPAVIVAPKPHQIPYSNESVKVIAKELFLEVINEMCSDLAGGLIHAITAFLGSGDSFTSDICEDAVQEMVRSISEEVLLEEHFQRKRIEDARRQQEADLRKKEAEIAERIAQRELATRGICGVVITEVLEEEIDRLAADEMRVVKGQLKKEQVSLCTDDISHDIVSDVVTDIIQAVADEVYDTDVTQRLQKLAEFEHCVKVTRSLRYWKRWKRQYAKRIRLKLAMTTFPSGPPGESLEQQIQSFVPEQKQSGVTREGAVFVNKSAKLFVTTPQDKVHMQDCLEQRVLLHHLTAQLRHDRAWRALDLARSFYKLQRKRHDSASSGYDPRTLYWKLILSLSEVKDQSASNHCIMLNDWLRAKFQKGAVPESVESTEQTELLSLYTVPFTSGDGDDASSMKKGQLYSNLGVCVWCIHGRLGQQGMRGMQEDSALLGTSCIWLVIPPSPDSSQSAYQEVEQRLAEIFQTSPALQNIPVVLVTTSKAPVERVTEPYIKQGQISECHQLDLKYSLEDGFDILSDQAIEKLHTAVEWCASHIPAIPKLFRLTLREIVEDFLAAEFYTPVLQNLAVRRKQGFVHLEPNVMILLYNSVLEYLAALLSQQELEDISWPVSEFAGHKQHDLPHPKWNSPENLSEIRALLLDMTLPTFEYSSKEASDWTTACDDVWRYVNAVVEGDCESSAKIELLTRLRTLLHATHSDFDDLCYLSERATSEPSYDNMPWTDILLAIVHYRILITDWIDPLNKQQDYIVYYMPIEPFEPPTAWMEAVTEATTKDSVQLKTTIVKAASLGHGRRALNNTEWVQSPLIELSNKVHNTAILRAANVNPLSADVQKATETSTQLLDSVHSERQSCDKFESYLEQALKSGNLEEELLPDLNQLPLVTSDAVCITPIAAPRRKPVTVIEESTIFDDIQYTSHDLSITTSLDLLKGELDSEKSADKLFEMRLKAWLEN